MSDEYPGNPIKMELQEAANLQKTMALREGMKKIAEIRAVMTPLERFIEDLSGSSYDRAVTVGELLDFARLAEEAIHDLEINTKGGR